MGPAWFAGRKQIAGSFNICSWLPICSRFFASRQARGIPRTNNIDRVTSSVVCKRLLRATTFDNATTLVKSSPRADNAGCNNWNAKPLLFCLRPTGSRWKFLNPVTPRENLVFYRDRWKILRRDSQTREKLSYDE